MFQLSPYNNISSVSQNINYDPDTDSEEENAEHKINDSDAIEREQPELKSNVSISKSKPFLTIQKSHKRFILKKQEKITFEASEDVEIMILHKHHNSNYITKDNNKLLLPETFSIHFDNALKSLY